MALRSFLYAPGHEPALMVDAFRHGADAVVFDPEDGVPAERRDEVVAVCAVGPIDSVYRGDDDGGLRAAAESARRLGFSGTSTLRPDQVAGINAVFSETLPAAP